MAGRIAQVQDFGAGAVRVKSVILAHLNETIGQRDTGLRLIASSPPLYSGGCSPRARNHSRKK